MEAFDPDQSEASLFVGTYRVAQQDYTPKIETSCMAFKALPVFSEPKRPHWDRFVFVCVRFALLNVHRQSKFWPLCLEHRVRGIFCRTYIIIYV